MTYPASIPFGREAILKLLQNAGDYEWSVQGFGMLRTYLDYPKRWRLNVWDQRLAVPGVSTVHDHPWHFDSVVVGGIVINQRLDPVPWAKVPLSQRFSVARIKTGEGGGPTGEPPQVVGLIRRKPEVILAGQSYHQQADEIHESMPLDGTVTLNSRDRLPDGEHARVFWPYGETWVDAEPRVASPDEVSRTVGDALKNWF